MVSIFEIIGAVGLALMIAGVLLRKRKIQDILFTTGGICLVIYSVWIKNTIFIILELVFTAAAVYDLVRLHYNQGKL